MNWLQDLRFAFRMIRKRPWFSAAIVVTLAFGMGVNTTVFSLVNAVLYKPLPFPGGDRLVMVSASNPSAGRDTVPVSYADFRDFRDSSHAFEHLEILNRLAVNLGERGNPPERYSGAGISAGMFRHAGYAASCGSRPPAVGRKAGGGAGDPDRLRSLEGPLRQGSGRDRPRGARQRETGRHCRRDAGRIQVSQ